MLCELCHQQEATVHITNLTPDKILGKSHFCASCAPSNEQMKQEALKQFLKRNSPDTASDQGPHDAT
jgi:protein-arginine kinase activator protein McsA